MPLLQLTDLQQQPFTFEIIGDLFVDFSFVSVDNRPKSNSADPFVLRSKAEILSQNFRPKSLPAERAVIASRGSSSLRPKSN